MNKKLHFKINTFNHAPFDSQVLAILSDDLKCYDWKMSYFFHMHINKKNHADYLYPKLPWYHCPFLDVYEIPTVFVQNHFSCFVDFVRASIELDCYILCGVDMYEIPEYKIDFHTCHNPMIIGINDKKEVVYMADFFCQQYKVIEVSFVKINLAFTNLKLCIDFESEEHLNLGKISLVRRKTNTNFKFEINNFTNELSRFLLSINLLYEDNAYLNNSDEINDYVFGLSCYDYAIKVKPTIRILSLFLLRADIWSQRLMFLHNERYLFINQKIFDFAEKMINTAQKNISLLLYINTTPTIEKKESKIALLKKGIEECKHLEIEIIDYIVNTAN